MSPTDKQIRDVEAAIDEVFHAAPLPTADRATALWYILTICEDLLRLAIIGGLEQLRLFTLLDEQKYALKFALAEVCWRLPNHPGKIQPAHLETEYEAAWNFLRLADDYETASIAFTSFHREQATCVELDDSRKHVAFRPVNEDGTPIFFEFLTGIWRRPHTPVVDLIRWLSGGQPPRPLRMLPRNAVVDSRRRIRYAARKQIRELAGLLNPAIRLIPPTWKSTLGNGAEISLVLNALHVFCVQHVAANLVAAQRMGRRGVGNESALWVRNKAALVGDLAFLSGVSAEQVERVLEFLTYGYHTTNPDPALQPVIALSPELVAIPALITCSGHVERNFLTLSARIDRETFDRNSHLFEAEMTARLEEMSSSRSYRTISNVTLSGSGRAAGEIDLIVADEQSKVILVIELRWMIPPGDPTEVWNREAVIPGKRGQAERKAQAVGAQLGEVLQRLNIEHNAGWDVHPMVVLEGFAGGMDSRLTPRVLTTDLYEIALLRTGKLGDFLAWLGSDGPWPKMGLDLALADREARLGQYTLRWRSFELLPGASERMAALVSR
jgi:hypothetical protein